MSRTLREKALSTAALFDVHEPKWAERIDFDELDMGCFYTCMLGLLYGNFYSNELPAFLQAPPMPQTGQPNDTAARDAWGFEFGLTSEPSADAAESEKQWTELTDIWTYLIHERLAVPAAFTPAG